MRFFGLKTCDTCKKALKKLAENQRFPEVFDVRDDGMSQADRLALLEAVGDSVLNRASTTWRNLSEADRARPPLDLLAEHPTLMKRPAIERDGHWTIGWKADVQAIWLND